MQGFYQILDPLTKTETFSEYPPGCEAGDPFLSLTGSDELINSVLPLKTEGWMAQQFLDTSEFFDLKEHVTAYVKELILKHQSLQNNFTLEDYHKNVEDDRVHRAISVWGMSYKAIGEAYEIVKQKLESLLQVELAIKKIEHLGVIDEYVGFRIVRPAKSDHNPIHRDAWLPYWRDNINVWIPLAGFENSNTISILPKSHRINDAEIIKTKKGAIINGNTYHVPAAIGIKQPVTFFNPELEAGEGLIFSPYILHGNGINHFPDTTRVSIELRFIKKK